MTRYNAATDALDSLFDMDAVTGDLRDSGRATQCKIHYSFAPDPETGILYAATHLSGPPKGEKRYNPWASWHDPVRAFRGAYLVAYDTKADAIRSSDLMIPREGCRCLCLEPRRRLLYALTYPRDHFVVYDLATRELRDHGRLGSVNAQCIFTDRRGRGYTFMDTGRVVRFDPDRNRLEELPHVFPHERCQTARHGVVYDAVADPATGAVYAVPWKARPHLLRYFPDEGPDGRLEDLGLVGPPTAPGLPIAVNRNHAGGLVLHGDWLYYVVSHWLPGDLPAMQTGNPSREQCIAMVRRLHTGTLATEDVCTPRRRGRHAPLHLARGAGPERRSLLRQDHGQAGRDLPRARPGNRSPAHALHPVLGVTSMPHLPPAPELRADYVLEGQFFAWPLAVSGECEPIAPDSARICAVAPAADGRVVWGANRRRGLPCLRGPLQGRGRWRHRPGRPAGCRHGARRGSHPAGAPARGRSLLRSGPGPGRRGLGAVALPGAAAPRFRAGTGLRPCRAAAADGRIRQSLGAGSPARTGGGLDRRADPGRRPGRRGGRAARAGRATGVPAGPSGRDPLVDRGWRHSGGPAFGRYPPPPRPRGCRRRTVPPFSAPGVPRFSRQRGGALHDVDPGAGTAAAFARPPLPDVQCLAGLPDGRAYGVCGHGIGHVFRADRAPAGCVALGAAATAVNHQRYGFEFAAAAASPEGVLFLAEHDRGGHLWAYYPPLHGDG